MDLNQEVAAAVESLPSLAGIKDVYAKTKPYVDLVLGAIGKVPAVAPYAGLIKLLQTLLEALFGGQNQTGAVPA